MKIDVAVMLPDSLTVMNSSLERFHAWQMKLPSNGSIRTTASIRR